MERDRPSRRHVANSNPGSRHRQSFSIRTANHTSPPAMQQASNTPSQPYPVYPLPIPQDKKARALELYKQYCDAHLKEKVENSHLEPQSAASHHDGYHLNVPRPPTAHSVTSYTSSRYSLTSGYDAVTDLSSVVSFDDEDEPTSAAAKAEGELLSFDGRKIKQRRRKKLNPVARAKAALVRHLGSCWVCRSRRVKCPLEHHDIDLLESLRQKRLEERPRGDYNSGSSISSSSQQTATSVSRMPSAAPGVSQTDALMGIGENPDISRDLGSLGNLDTTQLDIASPGGDVAYGDILLDIQPQGPLAHVTPSLPDLSPNPYTTYQDGSMLAIGVQRDGGFCCQHLGAFCNRLFPTSEELQTHFEIEHFSFTRIDPAHRYLCSSCNCLNNDILGPCSTCFSMGTIEVWIYGHFISILFFQRHAPEPQGIRDMSPAGLLSNVSYSFSDAGEEHWGPGGNYGGYTNTGNSGFQGGNSFEYQRSNHSNYSTNRFQRNAYDGARQTANGTFSARAIFGKHAPRHHKDGALYLCLLLVVTMLGFTLDWILAAAPRAIPHLALEFPTRLFLMGLCGIVASFGTYLPVKQIAAHRLRHTRLTSHRASHKLMESPFRIIYGQAAPATFSLGGRFS